MSNAGEDLRCLVERCNHGDEEAWQEFYARYRAMVKKAVDQNDAGGYAALALCMTMASEFVLAIADELGHEGIIKLLEAHGART